MELAVAFRNFTKPPHPLPLKKNANLCEVVITLTGVLSVCG